MQFSHATSVSTSPALNFSGSFSVPNFSAPSFFQPFAGYCEPLLPIESKRSAIQDTITDIQSEINKKTINQKNFVGGETFAKDKQEKSETESELQGSSKSPAMEKIKDSSSLALHGNKEAKTNDSPAGCKTKQSNEFCKNDTLGDNINKFPVVHKSNLFGSKTPINATISFSNLESSHFPNPPFSRYIFPQSVPSFPSFESRFPDPHSRSSYYPLVPRPLRPDFVASEVGRWLPS